MNIKNRSGYLKKCGVYLFSHIAGIIFILLLFVIGYLVLAVTHGQGLTPVASVLIGALISMLATFGVGYFEFNRRKKFQVWEDKRRIALNLFKIIDHIVDNFNIAGMAQSNQHSWNIQFARDTLNEIVLNFDLGEEIYKTFCDGFGFSDPAMGEKQKK